MLNKRKEKKKVQRYIVHVKEHLKGGRENLGVSR